MVDDYSSLETLAKKAISEKQPFVRLMVTKEDLLEMFKVFYQTYVAQQVQAAFYQWQSSG